MPRSAGVALLNTLILAIVVACSADSVEEVIEIQPRNTPGVLEVAGPDEGALLRRWEERLSSATEELRIGSLDSPDDTFVFGEIVDLLSDEEGNLLVLDSQSSNLRTFSTTGHHLHTVGRAGRGPGELMTPNAMEWLSSSELAIVDGTRRLQRFRYVAGEQPEYLAEVPTEIPVAAICRAPSGLWIHGLDIDSKHLIHLLDPVEGGLTARLTPASDVANPLLQMRQDIGHMDCFTEAEGGFALTSRYFPYVRALNRSGGERWHATIPDFQPMEFTLLEQDGRIGLRQGISAGAGGFHLIQSVAVLDATIVLVQVGWVSEEGYGENHTSLESFLFSSRTGRSVRVTRELPLIHRTTRGGFLASTSEPFPQAMRYRFVDWRTE